MENHPWIKIIEEDSPALTPVLKDMYKRMAQPDGSIDNILKLHSLHPESLEVHWNFYRLVMHGPSSLTLIEREILAVGISAVNECHY